MRQDSLLCFRFWVMSSDHVVLRAVVSAYLGRCQGATRRHTESDPRIFLCWCVGQDLDPLVVLADTEKSLLTDS